METPPYADDFLGYQDPLQFMKSEVDHFSPELGLDLALDIPVVNYTLAHPIIMVRIRDPQRVRARLTTPSLSRP